MSTPISEAFRGAAASIENLIRTIVREELRHHLGPEADHLINVKSAPMSARKLRALIRSGELRGYRHGKDTFVSASEFRAFIEGRPVQRPKPLAVAEPNPDSEHDARDDVMVTLRIVPKDPEERRVFEARIARRRAEGGERAATLHHAEQERVRMDEDAKRSEERRVRRAEKKRLREAGPRNP
jgi:hypothetical protein